MMTPAILSRCVSMVVFLGPALASVSSKRMGDNAMANAVLVHEIRSPGTSTKGQERGESPSDNRTCGDRDKCSIIDSENLRYLAAGLEESSTIQGVDARKMQVLVKDSESYVGRGKSDGMEIVSANGSKGSGQKVEDEGVEKTDNELAQEEKLASNLVESARKEEHWCGQGEFRRLCTNGERCCNESCGICATKENACVQITCGILNRWDSQYQSPRDLRNERHEVIAISLAEDTTLPAKDRLLKLQGERSELFQHVSVKGLKRLISQVMGPPPLSTKVSVGRVLEVSVRDTVVAKSPLEQHSPSPPRPALVQDGSVGMSPIKSNGTPQHRNQMSSPDMQNSARTNLAQRTRRRANGGGLERHDALQPLFGEITEAGGAEDKYQLNRTASENVQTSTGLRGVDLLSAMDGTLDREVSKKMMDESDKLGTERANAVRAAMQHIWNGYKAHAWGRDEVKPLGKTGTDNWGGMGVTLVDSLDTLWLMGMKKEFYNARDWVRDQLTFDNAGSVSVFETTIRVLGGLLSAYDLSKDHVFLERAKELADRLLPAFESATGLPYRMVHLSSGKTGNAGGSVLSELGTLQLEFRYLSRALGDSTYANKTNQVFEFLAKKSVPHGLYPIRINPDTGHFTGSQVTFGALGDSFYEYLLKVWIQGGRIEGVFRSMYDKAMDGVAEVLVKKSGGLTYLSEWNGSEHQHRMDHLACFVAGNLALGAFTTKDPLRAARDLKTGKALAYTCYQMYSRMPTGLPPETVEFHGDGEMRVLRKAHFYVLRPETVESFFILHQLTGDPIYRDWGWEIFSSIEKYCKAGAAYGSHPDVRDTSRQPEDHMESFFPGETLKYLYLLMQPDHPVDLMTYTFNTEAHPLKIFEDI